MQGQRSAEPAGGAPIARKSVQQNKSYISGTKFPFCCNTKHVWRTPKRAFGIAGEPVWALLLQKSRWMQYFSCFSVTVIKHIAKEKKINENMLLGSSRLAISEFLLQMPIEYSVFILPSH